MDVSHSRLREALRNASVSRFALVIGIALVLPACARLAGLESSESEGVGPTGSPKPASELPPDDTLRPAPKTDCGDRSNSPNNCGWCDHSCGAGATCEGGHCSQTAVVQASSVQAFVSDGASLWMIADKTPVRCSAEGPVTQTCTPIVRSEDVNARLNSDGIHVGVGVGVGGWGGNNNNNNNNNNKPPKALDAKSIAREKNHIVITDDAYQAVLACPLTGSCTTSNLAIIDARAEESEDTRSFGRSLASGPSGLNWSQGDELFAGVLPFDGQTKRFGLLKKNDPSVARIERILAPAGIFWISSAGLHHTPSVVEPPERWSARVSTDLSVDTNSVYVAGNEGLFRVDRTNPTHPETVAAMGEFGHVAADATGLYATLPAPNGGTAIVEVRAKGQLLEVAVVPGSVDSLAIVEKQLFFQTRVGSVDEIRRVAR